MELIQPKSLADKAKAYVMSPEEKEAQRQNFASANLEIDRAEKRHECSDDCAGVFGNCTQS